MKHAAVCILWGVCHSFLAAEFDAIPLLVEGSSSPGFDLVAASQSGIQFTNRLSTERSVKNQIYLNGSGVAAGDVNGDGLCDLYFCGLESDNALYLNQGDWKFVDVAIESGVACSGLFSTGTALADLDGDGDLDLLVNTVLGGTLIFFNDGQGNFEQDETNYPTTRRSGSMSMALADADQDGDLDLYVANYRPTSFRDAPHTRFHVETIRGRQVITHVDGRSVREPDLMGRFVLRPDGGVEERGEMDAFYLNDGKGRFRPVSFVNGAFLDEAGGLIDPPFDWGLSVLFRDLNQDRLPDLYVCNDFASPDRIWINQGNAKFRAIPLDAIRKTSRFSMGVDVADFDRDGYDDLFVLDMLGRDHVSRIVQVNEMPGVNMDEVGADDRLQYPRNTLLRQRPDFTYAEIAQMVGVEASGWSWSVAFVDVDLDGYEDLLITTGHERDAQNIDIAKALDARIQREGLSRDAILMDRLRFPRLASANVAFRNVQGKRFESAASDWGFDQAGVSHGMALADLDQDGDLDVAINNLNGEATLLRNRSAAPRISISLEAKSPNTQGIGAVITLQDDTMRQTQHMISGGRYLSSDQPIRVFAARTNANAFRVEVLWPNGIVSGLDSLSPNMHYRIREPSDSAEQERLDTPSAKEIKDEEAGSLFQHVDSFEHIHVENPFDDFSRQPALSRKLSHGGPGLSWTDWNQDGLIDLLVGAARGGRLSLFLNSEAHSFSSPSTPPFQDPVSRDTSGLLGGVSDEGPAFLLCGFSNYEDGLAIGGAVMQYRPEGTRPNVVIGDWTSSTGPLAMADVDADGDLDLFVGGQCLPGRYPEPVDSVLYINQGGTYDPLSGDTIVFQQAGLVSGAVFSDLDRNGFPDLILACEWGPIRVFLNDRGRFEERTGALGLSGYLGWWNGVTTGDFNGDGRMDIIATNWGRNHSYQTYLSHPIRLHYTDVNEDGILEFLESHFDDERDQWLPHRGWDAVRAVFPGLSQVYRSYQSFAEADVPSILNPISTPIHQLEANTLETRLFINRGSTFEPVGLPDVVQESSAFGVVVADFNGDGHEDLYLAQNFFQVSRDESRMDAGRGLVLLGNGDATFRALNSIQSGIRLQGDQRAAAVADFNRDGRIDLAVTQNNGATAFFRNKQSAPGLRILLRGGQGNPNGVGAILRLTGENGKGPAREIRLGEGYWSQNDTVQILSQSGNYGEVEVLWPGGIQRQYSIEIGEEEILLHPDGRKERRR